MRKYLLVLLGIISLLVFCRCSNEKEEIVYQEEENTDVVPENLQGQAKALLLVKEFAEKIHQSSRASSIFNFSDLEIEKVEKSSLPVKFSDKVSTLARSSVEDMKERVDLYTFTFKKDGNKGFAISTDDARCARVLAYVENGSLADTINCPGASVLLQNFSQVIALDLNRYYRDKEYPELSRAANSDFWQSWQLSPNLKTKWHFRKVPYNNNYPYPSNGASKCEDTDNGKYPTSMVAISLAQCLASYSVDYDLPILLTSKYNVRVFGQTETISTSSTHAAKVAAFIRSFDDTSTSGGFTKFTCSNFGPKTELRQARIGLANLGLTDQYYLYNANASINLMLLNTFRACRWDCPTIYAGYNNNSSIYGAWIIDGFIGMVNSNITKTEDVMVHCCFNYGEQLIGWYANAHAPKNSYGQYVLSGDYSYYMESLHFRAVCPWCVMDY